MLANPHFFILDIHFTRAIDGPITGAGGARKQPHVAGCLHHRAWSTRLIHGLCAARALSCKANQAIATAEDG
jgi:hypothetical protein